MGILKLTGYSGEAEILGAARRITVDGAGIHIHDVSLHEASDIIEVLSGGRLDVYQPAGSRTQAAAYVFTAESVEIPTVDQPEKRGCGYGKCASPDPGTKPPQEEESDGDAEDGEPESQPESQPESPPKKPVKSKPAARPARQKPLETSKGAEPADDGDTPDEKLDEIQVAAPKRRPRAAAATKKRSVADDMVQDPPKDVAVGSSEDLDDAIVVDPEEEAASVESDESQAPDGGELFGALLAAGTMREVINVFLDNGIKDLASMQAKAKELQASVPVLKIAGASLATRLARTAKGMDIV